MHNAHTLGNVPTMSTKWKSRFQEVLHSHFGGNQRRMSMAAGMNETWVRDVLKAKGPPKVDSLSALSEATGIPVAWFVDGDGDNAFSEVRPYKGQLPGAVPQIDAEAGAGDGRVGEMVAIHSGGVSSGHRVVSEWVIPRAELGVEPSRVVILPVIGTSMAPSLLPGDKVIVDTQATSIKHGEIYVLDEGDGPVVKRARLLRDVDPILLEIISENPSVAPVRRPAEMVRVIGRVIGRWTRM